MRWNKRQIRRRRRARGFVLLEVLLALAILGFSVAALMRSFTQSMAAARRQEVMTQALFLGQQLLHEFEVSPPEEGTTEAGFGDTYKAYNYRVTLERITPKYRNLDKLDQVDDLFGMSEIKIEILYNDGNHAPFTPLVLHSALTGLEKFSPRTKRSYEMF